VCGRLETTGERGQVRGKRAGEGGWGGRGDPRVDIEKCEIAEWAQRLSNARVIGVLFTTHKFDPRFLASLYRQSLRVHVRSDIIVVMHGKRVIVSTVNKDPPSRAREPKALTGTRLANACTDAAPSSCWSAARSTPKSKELSPMVSVDNRPLSPRLRSVTGSCFIVLCSVREVSEGVDSFSCMTSTAFHSERRDPRSSSY
jgi:hypothetical protein